MKIRINLQERDFPPGTTFARVAMQIRESQGNDRATRPPAGQDHILFFLNGRVVTAEQFDSVELKEGDDIRWMHPYAGG